jgi:hypothetical protein
MDSASGDVGCHLPKRGSSSRRVATAFGTLMPMPRLTEPEYKATMELHPVPVDGEQAPPFDFWPYFESIPSADFEGPGWGH